MAKQRDGTMALVAHVDGPALRQCLQLLATPESRVVGNPSAPDDVLTAGAQASDLELRLQAARNPSTPSRALARLARDADRRVLHAAGTNPNAPAAAKRRAVTSLAGLDATLEHSLRKAGLEATAPATEHEEAAAD